MGLLPSNPGKPPGPPNNPPNPSDILPSGRPVQGFNKGTANVKPTKAVSQSWRGDANGSLSAAEHAGTPHPSLAPFMKK